MELHRPLPGVYEVLKDGEMKYRIYKNRWDGWTVAVFSKKHTQFIDSRYFKTLNQAKNAIL